MPKKGKVTLKEKENIQALQRDGKTTEEIAEILDRSESVISKYMTDEVEGKPKKKETFFIKETASKKNKGVSIMTAVQSERSDSTRAARQSKITNRYKSVIHTISKEEENG